MIELPVETLPVDFLTLFMSHFRNLAGKPDGRDQGFQATTMKSSEDEVREKEIAFSLILFVWLIFKACLIPLYKP